MTGPDSTELVTKSLGEIVNANHRAASVFEKHGLDFCCKGKRSLKQACAEKMLPVDSIVSELKAITGTDPGSVDFDRMSLTHLAAYIVATHHEYVKKEMPEIFSYLQKITAKHSERHPELYKVLETFSEMKKEMELHMEKEELILFPRIELMEIRAILESDAKVNIAFLQEPISMMEEEHEQVGQWLAEIRRLTNDYTAPGDACTTYRLSYTALQAFELDLHQHVHLENNILFPKALELFRKINSQLN